MKYVNSSEHNYTIPWCSSGCSLHKICKTDLDFNGGKLMISSASAASNDDNLLREFFFLLPVKSLLRFKLVSKHWRAIISDWYFVRHYSLRNHPTISGILLLNSSFVIHPEFDFISLDDPRKPAPFKSLRFVNDPEGIKIEQSCNGLLLCGNFRTMSTRRTYYIYNPTTRQYTILPEPCGVGRSIRSYICSISLAFDPCKSLDYKVVCIWRIGDMPAMYQFTTYSSYTTFWRLPRDTYTECDIGQFCNSGVFWNGALHWITTSMESLLYFDIEDEQQFTSESLLCFDVETELVRTMSLPPKPVEQGESRHDYFGASGDHLYLVERYDYSSQLNILEMGSDYSGWNVKYRINLDTLTTAYPEMVRNYLDISSDWNYYAFLVMLVQEEALTASLLLHTPGKIVCYNLKDKTLKTLRDLPIGIHEEGPYLQYYWFGSYQYIVTLSRV